MKEVFSSIRRKGKIVSAISIVGFLSFFWPGAVEAQYNPGHRVNSVSYRNDTGQEVEIPYAVWYPTQETPHPFTYETVNSYRSEVAYNASLASGAKHYPIIFFAHGGFGCGYDSAFFMEHLARQGYIVVAPDFDDTAPPDYTTSVSFARINKGKTNNALKVVAVAGKFAEDMSRDREKLLEYLKDKRLKEFKFVMRSFFDFNEDPNSFLYQRIDSEKVGVCGHSLGGATALGISGAFPDPAFHEKSIKATLLFSSPGYPFEDRVKNNFTPLMVMAGDDDNPGLGPNVPRKTLFDKAQSPKFYLVFNNATHFDFSNRGCGSLPLYEAVIKNPLISTIVEYGCAFFDVYVKGDTAQISRLKESNPALVYYAVSESQGQLQEWGEEPPPGESGLGGIKKIFQEKRNNTIFPRFRRRRKSVWD